MLKPLLRSVSASTQQPPTPFTVDQGKIVLPHSIRQPWKRAAGMAHVPPVRAPQRSNRDPLVVQYKPKNRKCGQSQ